MSEPSDLERDLQVIDAEMRRLEGEYNLYFGGRVPKPPIEARARLDALFKQWERADVESFVLRFRLGSLQSRYATFTDLWDRGMRAREEGRPGRFSRLAPAPPLAALPSVRDSGLPNRVVHVASLTDPHGQADKLRALFDAVAATRRETGEAAVPYERFADLVREQVRAFQQRGASEVAFRVSVQDGKVNLTARALRGAPG
jgi:hypothetical protein